MNGFFMSLKSGKGDSWGGLVFFPSLSEGPFPSERQGFTLSGRGVCIQGDLTGSLVSLPDKDGEKISSFHYVSSEEDEREAAALKYAAEDYIFYALQAAGHILK